MEIQVLGPDSEKLCYYYAPDLPDVLVIANECSERTFNDNNSHQILYCIKHNENYEIPKQFHSMDYFVGAILEPDWGWIGNGIRRKYTRMMEPADYKCWYKSGTLSDIPKNLSILMEVYKKNITSGSN